MGCCGCLPHPEMGEGKMVPALCDLQNKTASKFWFDGSSSSSSSSSTSVHGRTCCFRVRSLLPLLVGNPLMADGCCCTRARNASIYCAYDINSMLYMLATYGLQQIGESTHFDSLVNLAKTPPGINNIPGHGVLEQLSKA